MNSSNDNCAVKIAVRERPVRESLKTSKDPSVISYHPNANILIVDERPFTFDYVLGPSVTQAQVFEELIKPLVTNLKQGYNCTALAYGQTGTGKSYSMGLDSVNFEGENIGVIPRCLKEMFTIEENQIASETNTNFPTEKKVLSVSFIEIYNEKVYDLLAENVNEPIIAKGYRYTGGSRKTLKSIEDCYAILMQGNKNRHVRPTKMNTQSSRSHAIFTIHMQRFSKNASDEETIISSCMNIVDLAGSEGVRRTGHQGMAMSEGVNINQGLLSIGKVLQAMTMGSKVIPYRDSVLSSVLQDSLNANSYLTLLACISPHREDLSETLSTLRFAQNAKQLKNTPQINNIIADIKKNAKIKQTPYKVRPLQLSNTNKTTPLKRSYSALNGFPPKSAVKSNTFCTPKKQRVEINRCNQTEIATNNNRPKLSNIAMNLPQMGQLESTHNRESLFNRSLDSNGSLLSLNISTSTAVDGPVNNKGNNNDNLNNNSNFSPVIRKYMTELETGLEKKFMEILQRNLHAFIPTQTPAPTPAPVSLSQNKTPFPSSVRQEIKSIMKEVLCESPLKADAKCKLFNSSADLFKIPEVPEEKNDRPKTSSPNLGNERASFTETFFAGASSCDKNVLRRSIRRSRRISERFCVNESVLNETQEPNILNDSKKHATRRSSRRSVLQSYIDKRRSIRLASHPESVEQPTTSLPSKTPKKSRKSLSTSKSSKTSHSSSGVLISQICNATSTNSKTNLSRHRKAILELLNKGSMKEIQILPMVGQKRSFQIVTQRTLHGKFKNWQQVEKLPLWRGKEWERFAEANCLL
ncbi:kinesin-like protein Nod [Stomoxys calcitrans]|uniref:kinesin-like protein Nod n=1 Tax=Stomoxys calcitrans TaxID=35570 RepID=UPI0027E2E031|nr:kinesin-like protein Nod [Stomoxys calcitrans]